MKDNNNNSKQVLLSVLGVAILVVAVVGVSFAAFSYQGIGETENTISTGTISMMYNEPDNGINLTNALPTTDEQGKIMIPFLNPGTYYLEETSSSNGYELYQGLIQLEVDYNEEFTVIVNNQKGDKMEVETKTKTMEISQEKLPKAGM